MSTIREQLTHARAQELLTVNQLALLTQYAPMTIYRKAWRGEIPGMVRFGRGIRFVKTIALQWGQRATAERPSAE